MAVLLCSKVRADVAHVTQICVAKQSRGLGVGKLLLRTCAEDLADRGFSALTLTVTQRNSDAVSLYRSHGFGVKHTFDAMVWDERGM